MRKDALKACSEFDFALTTRLPWSKNVHEERDAPEQIMLAAMDPRYCVQLAFAIFLEVWIESGDGCLGDYVFCEAGSEPETAKANAYTALYNVLDGNEFHKLKAGPLGTHSIRKYGATTARRNGCSKDDVDYRGRWKGKARVSDLYADVTLPWPDIKVASKLCIGGPCKYVLKEGCGLSNNWLVAHVAPNISQVYGEEASAILGKALLWAIFDDVVSARVPPPICTRVLAAYNSLDAQHRLQNGENPVKKIRLAVSGSDGEVHLDEIPDDVDMGGARGPARREGNDEQMLVIYGRVASVDRKIDDYHNENRQYQAQMSHRLQTMERNISRIALQPVQRVRREENNNHDQTGMEAVPFVATLSPHPRDLFTLWQEYEFGIGGRKPARQFTVGERAKVKFKYCRRKIVWDVIDRLVRSRNTAPVAIDKIYDAYGRVSVSDIRVSVSDIINKIRQDTRDGVERVV
jgi:hypothetical protein